MNKTVANLKDDLEGVVHSTDVSEVRNLNKLIERAGRNLLTRIDPKGTIRIAQISNAVHNDIYDYSAPSDLKGDAIIDIRPQVNREEWDAFSMRFVKDFDLRKTAETMVVRYNSGEKSLRLSATLSKTAKTLHNMNSVSGNGTWAVGGDANNLTRDTNDYISGSASLNFDLSGAGTTGYIENQTMTAVDLSNEEDIGAIWVRVYIPDPTIITSFTLSWGSDSSNYWSATVTAPHDQTSFKTGWNILKFDWNEASKTGSPDASDVNYLKFLVTYDGTAETDIRVDKISCSAGEIYEIVYYSNCLFRTSGGTWSNTISDDTDYINLDEEAYNILIFECGKAISQQMQGEDAKFDYQYFEQELFGDPSNRREKPGLYAMYKSKYPSERIKARTYYWRKRTFD